MVLGAEFGGQLQAMFERDLASSDPVLLAAWDQRGIVPRSKELLARIWAYWL